MGLYKGVQKIPNIREAILIERETRPQWEYKYRSRYIVKPHLVEELAIHYVAHSVPGFRTLELSRDQIALAHFRSAKRSELDHLGVLDEHEVDLNLAHHYTPRLLERVNQSAMCLSPPLLSSIALTSASTNSDLWN